METLSVRAGILCYGETEAASFDKLAVDAFGRKRDPWRQLLKDACASEIGKWAWE